VSIEIEVEAKIIAATTWQCQIRIAFDKRCEQPLFLPWRKFREKPSARDLPKSRFSGVIRDFCGLGKR
jgi:hypothetical protein